MIVCSKCKSSNTPDSTFCGYCGAFLVNSDDVTDGKKNKKSLQFANKLYMSDSYNIFYIVVCSLILLFFINMAVHFCYGAVTKFSSLGYHIGQIAIKYEYVAEGIGISYIASSLIPIIDYIIVCIMAIVTLVDIPVIVFKIFFGTYILICKRKIANGNFIAKPVNLLKSNVLLLKWACFINIAAIALIIVVSLLKVYLG